MIKKANKKPHLEANKSDFDKLIKVASTLKVVKEGKQSVKELVKKSSKLNINNHE